MTRTQCERAESLAGAIALREATDAERHAYRGHIASCERCLEAIGGEQQIERVAETIARARDAERWEPATVAAARGSVRGLRVLQWAGTLAAIAVVGVGVATVAQHTAANHSLVVVQNVVTLARPTQAEKGSIAALSTQIAPKSSGRAESLKLVSAPTAMNAIVPIGGESSLVPHPPVIAYEQGANGTTAFDVRVDRDGTPVSCRIVKSSGSAALDASVCRAAMRARYVPRTVDGHAVDGVFHDAFTFRSSN